MTEVHGEGGCPAGNLTQYPNRYIDEKKENV